MIPRPLTAGLVAALLGGSVACAPASQPVPPSAPSATAPASTPGPSAATPSATPPASPSAPSAAVPSVGLAAPRETRAVGGIDFAVAQGPADLRIEASVAEGDAAALEAQVSDDVRSVERDFGMAFPRQPVIYVFAATSSYALGMSEIFGYPRPAAQWIAENSVAFFEPPLGLIGVNWEAVSGRRPIAAVRHELTHVMTLAACGPRCDLVPAWLNEGQARLAEAEIPGADWRLLRIRYEAASMAMTGTLIPLGDLVTQNAWNSLTSWAGYYKYQEAARATELLRADIGGDAPISRLYARIRQGEDVAHAYEAVTGRSFEAFVAGLEARMRSVATPGPGIVAIARSPDGPGASYLLYGFPPSAPVDVSIAGRRASATARVAVSPFGAVFETLADDLPRGPYEITATDGHTTVTAKVVKRSAGAALP